MLTDAEVRVVLKTHWSAHLLSAGLAKQNPDLVDRWRARLNEIEATQDEALTACMAIDTTKAFGLGQHIDLVVRRIYHDRAEVVRAERQARADADSPPPAEPKPIPNSAPHRVCDARANYGAKRKQAERSGKGADWVAADDALIEFCELARDEGCAPPPPDPHRQHPRGWGPMIEWVREQRRKHEERGDARRGNLFQSPAVGRRREQEARGDAMVERLRAAGRSQEAAEQLAELKRLQKASDG